MTVALDVRAMANSLIEAETSRSAREPVTDDRPDLDLDTAYVVQQEVLRTKLAQGERVVGIKLGLTSHAKQQQMNVSDPITGWLTDAMTLRPDEPLPSSRLIHPRVEPEIVFVMGARLAGPGLTGADALAAVAAVHGGLEVIDSRYRDFRFTLPDVVADNASAAGFVVSEDGRDPGGIDLVAERCVLSVDGQPAGSASGADVLGSPAVALASAANALARHGVAIEPGWIVLTGGMTSAVGVQPGCVIEADFTTLGRVRLSAPAG